MKIDIPNPQAETLIIITVLVVILILFAKRRSNYTFDIGLTEEMKGFAILAIVFSHIGYFLSRDTSFLYPVSILAGVGVNLFLFLSGFGISISQKQKQLSIMQFYRRRFIQLLIPFWIVITLFFVLDVLVLHRSYSIGYILQSYVGFFPDPDIDANINSPLWFFTLIAIYYLTFPIFFQSKLRLITPFLIYLIIKIVLILPLGFSEQNLKLYYLHSLAFPLGIMAALLYKNPEFRGIIKSTKQTITLQFHRIQSKWQRIFVHNLLYALFIGLLITTIGYFAINSYVGKGLETELMISNLNMVLIIILFLVKKFEFRVFKLFGKYSYEIYLLHWPILYRYDLIYQHLPASLATLLYLALFIILAYLLQKLSVQIVKSLRL
jgi:peptidoglycan/LPS O-acetylase OafA/YrhL